MPTALVPQEDIREVLLALNPEQIRFCFARITAKSDADAARRADVHVRTVAGWKATIPEINLAIRLLLLKPLEAALTRMEYAATEAADVMIGLLDSESESLQFKAANAILKHIGMGSTSYLEVRGQIKLKPDIPDNVLVEKAMEVMERSGHLLSEVVDGEVIEPNPA